MHAELPQLEPFSLRDSERVLRHPETPAAYTAWLEVLPLTGREDRVHVGNLLGWSKATADRTLGASRRVFESAFGETNDGVIDLWMEALGQTTIRDFVDHHVPFLRNAHTFVSPREKREAVSEFLELAGGGRGPPVYRTDERLRRSFPESVILEITRSCNFACTMCSSRTQGFRADRTMPLPVFGEFVRVFGPVAKTIRVNGYGESSLVPNLTAYLDCLDEFSFGGIREIITNLSGASEVYDDLFDRGFVLLASWDAASSELFERIRVGARYGELHNTLRELGRRARVQPERLGLLCTVQEVNLTEIVPVTQLAADVGAGLVIFNMVKEADGSPWMDTRFEQLRDLFSTAEEVAARSGVQLRIPDHIGKRRLRLAQTHRSSASFCDRPWRELMVAWDGEATVCNMFNPFSYGQLTPPGPAQDVSSRFRRLWEGPNAQLFRRLINSQTPHPYCRECYFLYP